MYESDFVNEDIVEFEIESRKFGYKPVTAGEESEWVDEYMETDKDGKNKQNFKKLTQCKVRNLVKVPYTQENIKKILSLDKEWKDLNKDQRWNLLSKLKPAVFTKIIQRINKIDNSDPEVKKN